MRRRSLVFVVSDFISVPGWEQRLGQLAQRHEVVAVRLHDPLEANLPDLGMLVVQDAETGEQIFVDTHDRGFRKRFAAAAAEREAGLRAAFRQCRHRRARAVHRRRPDRCHPPLRRHAQAPQPDKLRRRQCRPIWSWCDDVRCGRKCCGSCWSLPLLLGAYLWILQRKKKQAVRYASLTMVREAMGVGQRIRRHVPPALFFLALAAMLVALARPQATITLPTQHETVILAMDISGSMRATDVEPNRLVAAQNAAKQFVSEQPENVRVGVVAFAGTATVAQAPTRNREDVIAAIDRFQLQRATAIGSGIIVSLAAIFPDQGIDVGTLTYGADNRARPTRRVRRRSSRCRRAPIPRR